MNASRSVDAVTRFPSNFMITSPDLRPPLSAGPFAVTADSRTPPDGLSYDGASEAPRTVRRALPVWMMSFAIRLASLIGIEKPRPMLPLLASAELESDRVRIAELTPTTWPEPSSSGPPELPGLIAASVWIAAMYASL